MDRRFLVVSIVLLLAGCSTIHSVPRRDLRPDARFEKLRVATADGYEYRFEEAAVAADTLVGFYTVTVEQVGSGNDIWYEDVRRRHSIPLAEILRVDLVRRDPIKTAFYGATIAAAGYMLVTLVDETGTASTRTGSGGKPPIGPPPQ